jgi:4-amino-4-deoxy-L-arabinose transferase-like glycosyltransferase
MGADRRLLRRAGLIALAVAVVLCFAGVFQHGLWTPDEPREAEVGREMLLSRYSAVPTLGGALFMEKPPLFAWITAAAYSVFGVNDWAGRIPAALFSIGSIGIAYLLGKRAAGRLAGLCSAIALATMWQFAETSHKAALDDALTFFVAAGHLAFLRLRDKSCAWSYAAIGVCAGLAFMTKSFIGPALMCAPPILAAAAMKDGAYVKRVLPRAFVAAVVGVAAFGLPWVFAVVHTPGGGWPAVKTCLWTNTVGRSVTSDDSGFGAHAHNPFYYLYTWISVMAPWTLALPAAFVSGTLRRDARGGRTLFLGLVFVAGLVLLSLPSGKRELYLLPLLPVAAVVPGAWLSRVGSRSAGRWDAVTTAGVTWIACATELAVVAGGVLLSMRVGFLFFGDDEMRAAATEGARSFVRDAVPALLAATAAMLWLRRRFVTAAGLRAFRMAAATVLVFFVYHAAVRPGLDPMRDMSAGAREVASLVPADEPILLLHSDETMRAAIPFYTGRDVLNAVEVKHVMKALDAGRAKHLVVMDKHDEKITPELRARLVLLSNVRINASRTMDVYEVRAP